MIEKELGGRSDRSHLCLVAIYVIHALLLNVFLQPDAVMTSVTLSPSYVLRGSARNGSEATVATSDGGGVGGIAPIVNATAARSRERRTLEDDGAEYPRDVGEPILQQSQSSGAAVRFLAFSKSSGVTRIASNAIDTARQIVKSLSPASLGILSGCLVFLLTFTENDYV